MTKIFNIQDYENYFLNILKEKWEFDETKSLEQFQFDKNKVEEIIYENTYEKTSYLIGKCSNFYFLAVLEKEEDYHYTCMYKQDCIAPLIKNIKHMKQLHPNFTNKQFVKNFLLNKKLEEIFSEKETVDKKIKI